MEAGRLLLNRYEIERHLAVGAMSTVWIARDRVTEQEVAIKAISLESAGWRAEVRDRFQKEAQLLALCCHDNLVGVRGSGETDEGDLFLVLDLVLGETLADRLAREPRLGWREAARLALCISRAVGALHARGIVHRDLKPANIILEDRAGQIVPKVIDLGISKVLAGDPRLTATLTATGQVLGTPQYMSYEQALGEPDVDARSDVWALGAILYEMLAWRRPFHAPHINAVLAAIRRQDKPSLSDIEPTVPAALAAVVDTCMRKERAERFQDAAALADELAAVLAVSSSPPAAPGPSPAAPVRGTRLKVVAAATTLITGIVLGLAARGAFPVRSSVPLVASRGRLHAFAAAKGLSEARGQAPAAALSGNPAPSSAPVESALDHTREAPQAEPSVRPSRPRARSAPVTRVNDSGL